MMIYEVNPTLGLFIKFLLTIKNIPQFPGAQGVKSNFIYQNKSMNLSKDEKLPVKQAIIVLYQAQKISA